MKLYIVRREDWFKAGNNLAANQISQAGSIWIDVFATESQAALYPFNICPAW